MSTEPEETRHSRRGLLAVLKEIPSFLLALIASVSFGLSFGLNYGTDNQTAYMLGALRLLDKSVLNKDWYAAGTANYHPAFSVVGWLLLLPSRRGMGVGIGLVAVVTIGSMALYWLTRKLVADKRLALATFLLLLAVAFITRTHSVAVSYIFDFILQPSTLGSLFLLLALPPFVDGRFVLSGVFLGLSGLFHANYLILGIGTFGFAHILMGKQDLVKRLVRQLGPSALVLLVLSPLILRSAVSPGAAEAQNILFNIRSPHHYSPKTYEHAFFPFAAWQMIGIGAGGWQLRGMSGKGARLSSIIAAMAAVIWTGTLLTTVVVIRPVIQLFVWRYAPFLEALMQLLFCMAAVRVAADPALLKRITPASLGLFWGGAVLMAMLNVNAGRNQETLSLAILLIAIPPVLSVGFSALARVLSRFSWANRARVTADRQGGWLLLLIAAAVCAGFASPQIKSFRKNSNLLSEGKGAEADMYAWIREHTAKDAVFLTPPQLERFRIGAERAIVVDWKGSTYVPGELLDWYKRLEDVSGHPGFRGLGDLTSGYASLDEKRLTALRAKYDLDYAVVYKGKEDALHDHPTAYANGQFVVLALK